MARRPGGHVNARPHRGQRKPERTRTPHPAHELTRGAADFEDIMDRLTKGVQVTTKSTRDPGRH
jgi:hypothetical protein